MKLTYLTGTLLFLAIVNIVAVDTYLYFKLVRGTDEAAATAAIGAPGAVATDLKGSVSKLDQAQRKELSRIKKEFREATGALHGRIRELEDEMYRLVQEEPASREKIESNLEEHGRLRLELKRIAIRKMIETRDVLNAEQKAELFRAIFRSQPRPSSAVVRPDSAGRGDGPK